MLSTPAPIPTASATAGFSFRLAAEPMATPPAKVAFWMCTIFSVLLWAAEAANAATHAPTNASTVLTMHRNCCGLSGMAGLEASAALKLGCNNQTKRELVQDGYACRVSAIMQVPLATFEQQQQLCLRHMHPHGASTCADTQQ